MHKTVRGFCHYLFIHKKKNTFSLEAANAPNNFLRRAYEYAKLSAYKYLAISDFTLVEATFFIAN